jgi:hypothetical protein
MALIKKSDVNDYFAAKRRARLHLLTPSSTPAEARTKRSGFVKDFLGEHTTPKNPIEPGADEGRGAL